MKYIRWFKDISMDDVSLVGGKNASLGQMISHLSSEGITVPNGFAVTAQAYWAYLDHNQLRAPIQQLLAPLNLDDVSQLHDVASQIRSLMVNGTIPQELRVEIERAYQQLSTDYGASACDVAVRSSATAEDLPTASFAGQQETYLNVHGIDEVLIAYQKGLASLFTDRAIVYRSDKGFDHFAVAVSIGIQKMIRSDKACAGVAFSLDPETGFSQVIVINGSYGLGESIVQGAVTPDEFVVHKPTLRAGYEPIIRKRLGDKKIELVYGQDQSASTVTRPVLQDRYQQFCLSDAQILTLAHMVMTIEDHYSSRAGHHVPMDIEWALDGIDGKLYIIQARPETVHTHQNTGAVIPQYEITKDAAQAARLVSGQSIGQGIVHGTARVISQVSDINRVQPGDIIVTTMTDPDWVPAMKRAVGIITNQGGRTCHAAIVSRELRLLALVGTGDATEKLRDGQLITIDCSQGLTGFVYDGHIPFTYHEQSLDTIPTSPVPIMVNIADPDSAFQMSFLPVAGVGLARIEFIISGLIKIHPMALIHPERVDEPTHATIAQLTHNYGDKKQYFVELLSYGVATIAAAFYPRPVIVRLSDLKSNEYRDLIGGTFFEPHEENPMLGFRGASRYYHPDYQEAFALECAALVRVRKIMGLTNVRVMVPFVRTMHEAQLVLERMEHHGLVRGQDELQIIMMCELPANVIKIDTFSTLFDGFSIGSNDLTQTTLGVDRDSMLLAPLFDERDEAVQKMLRLAIAGAQAAGKPIGICGQAPSDYPELAQTLIAQGISSVSLNSDSVIPFLMRYAQE